MKKILSLIKVSMTQNMNIFRVSTKNKSTRSKIIIPIALSLLFMMSMGTYADTIMSSLKEQGLEYIVLTLFVGFSSILTIIEGIYKSKDLLFNRKR